MNASNNPGNLFNQPQRNRLSVTCAHIDKLLKDIEETLDATASKSPFPKYVSDVSPTQRRVIEDYIARLRAQLLRVLEGVQIPVPNARISASHSIYTSLTFIDIAVEELKPRYMRGYGDVPTTAQEMLNGIVAELESLVRQLNRYLGLGMGSDFEKRLKVLEALGAIDVHGLKVMEQIISRHGLVEFRPALATILERLEDQTFEIAVFGRVSSGKSSLLNRILETDILPVGVTPITAVPTRVRIASMPQLSVTFAGFGTQTMDVSRIAEFATEQQNPANAKRVAKLVVTLTSPKLRKGVTFVDTPGLGSLATSGAAETMAYLPRCDFAIVLIDAGATLSEEDLRLLRTLNDIGITSSVLLSKADLVDESQRSQLLDYVAKQIGTQLGVKANVVPVSAEPAYQHMLDDWYQNQLVPLFDNAQDLRRQSVSRKIGSLRATLESSLRAMKKHAGPKDSRSVAEEEEALRRFSGRFVVLKKDTHAIVDQIDTSSSAIVHEAVVRAWEFRKAADFNIKLREQIDSLTNDFGAVIFGKIQQFIPEMIAQLMTTAAIISSPAKPQEQDFAGIAQEVPRFEAPPMASLEIRQSGIASLLGTTFSQESVAKQVKNLIGTPLYENLSFYRTVLRNWVESTVSALHAAFDSFAEPYRGSMRRELGVDNPNNSDNQIETDLKSLEELTVSAA